MRWQKPLIGINIMSLGDNVVEAMDKMNRLTEIQASCRA
jgi:hypothetical protein